MSAEARRNLQQEWHNKVLAAARPLPAFSADGLMSYLPDASKARISRALGELARQGKIRHVGRGVYSMPDA